MGLMKVFENVSTIIHCFKEGTELISQITEQYEKYNNKPIQKTKNQSLLQCNAIHFERSPLFQKPKLASGCVFLYISDQLYSAGLHQNKVLLDHRIRFNHFSDTQDMDCLSSVIMEHPTDSVIVIRNHYQDDCLTLLFELLNIVPGSDDICYRMSCQTRGVPNYEDYTGIANSLLEDVVTNIMQLYQKYQQPLYKNIDRLELEARILQNLGYTNIAYQQISTGYSLNIQLGRKTLVLGIPYAYPLKAPTILLVQGASYQEIEFDNDWEPFLTTGHIVSAIENEEKKQW